MSGEPASARSGGAAGPSRGSSGPSGGASGPSGAAKPGEILLGPGRITLNQGRRTDEIDVANASDHTIFVSSHFPFFEVNRRLVFDRARAWGMHLDIPAGDSVRWRPGEMVRVRLVAFGGRGVVVGFNGLTEGAATPERLGEGLERARRAGYAHQEAAPPSR
jgi:urease subunit gamma/beta